MSFEYPCEDMIFKINEHKRELTLKYAEDVAGRFSMTFDEVDGLFVVYRTEVVTNAVVGLHYVIREVRSMVSNKHYVFNTPVGLPYSCIIEMKVEPLKFKFTKDSFNPKVKYSADVTMADGSTVAGEFTNGVKRYDGIFVVLESRGDNLIAFQNVKTKVKFQLLNQNYVDMQTLIMNPDEPEVPPVKFKFTKKSLASFNHSTMYVSSSSGNDNVGIVIDEQLFDTPFVVVKTRGLKLLEFKHVGGDEVYTIHQYPIVWMSNLEMITNEAHPSTGEMVFPTETLEDPNKNYMVVVDSNGYSLQDKERNVLAQSSSQNGIKEISPVAKSIFEGLENVI